MPVTYPSCRNRQEPVRTSILYINDYHGATTKMGELKTASDYFSKTKNSQDTDTFKLAAGDILKGNNNNSISMWVEFLNRIGLDLSAIGNHELDQGAKAFNDSVKGAKFGYVSSNIEVNPYGQLSPAVRSKGIMSSRIENRNGHLYGFVGLTPTDAKYKEPGKKLNNNDIKSMDTTASLARVQAEVDKLRQQGINKIILLSHFDDMDNKISKNISGVDIIVSGHKHRTYDGVMPGKNLFNSPAGEPVIKVESGRDGHNIGVLDVTFDQNGVITGASNKLTKTASIPEDISIIPLKQRYQAYEEPIGILKNTARTEQFGENAIANFVADAIKAESGADIVLIPSASIYEDMGKGIVTDGDIKRALPFSSDLYEVTLSEKDIIKALTRGAKPSEDDDTESNILQASGLRYTITQDNHVKEVYFESPDGKLIALNSENPDKNKKFKVVYDKFLLKGKNNFDSLKRPENEAKQLSWDAIAATGKFIRNKGFVPFNMVNEGRINIDKKAV